MADDKTTKTPEQPVTDSGPGKEKPEDEYTVYEVDGSDTDEEADLLNFDDLDSDEFV